MLRGLWLRETLVLREARRAVHLLQGHPPLEKAQSKSVNDTSVVVVAKELFGYTETVPKKRTIQIFFYSKQPLVRDLITLDKADNTQLSQAKQRSFAYMYTKYPTQFGKHVEVVYKLRRTGK